MPDEQNQNTDTPTQTAAPATQPSNGQPQITPEIQAIIDQRAAEAAQQAKNAAWAEARRTFEAKQKQSGGGNGNPSTPSNGSPATPAPDPFAILKLRDDFDDATSELTLSGDQKRFLRNLVMEKRPEDVAEYVTSFVKAWGTGKAATPATPAPENPAPKTPTQGPPVTGSGAPASPNVVTDDTPILRMSESDRIALRRRIGDAAYVERMRKEFRQNNVRVRFR